MIYSPPTHADAWQAWMDLAATDRGEWRTFMDYRNGATIHALEAGQPFNIRAVPYRAFGGGTRYQVYVTECAHPAGHMFPVDSLDEAADQGLTICMRMNPGGER